MDTTHSTALAAELKICRKITKTTKKSLVQLGLLT